MSPKLLLGKKIVISDAVQEDNKKKLISRR